MVSPTHQPELVRRAGILGIGYDNDDGHTRITHGEQLAVIGGSTETHKEMQSQVMWFMDQINGLGKSLEELNESELDMLIEGFQKEFGIDIESIDTSTYKSVD